MTTQHIARESVYRFVRDYIQKNGFSPSLREISIGCAIAGQTVRFHLIALEAQGRIRRRDGIARSIVLVDTDEPTD